MSYSSFKPLALAAALASSACASMSPAPDTTMIPNDAMPAYMQPIKEWPLRFKAHSFSVMTYDTWGVEVVYAGRLRRQDDPDVLQRSSASYGPDWQRGWGGTYGDIGNFPPPAQLRWRSKDGTPIEAEIDVGAIFSDEVIRQDVTREEMAYLPDGKYEFEPAIILEINDRTVRVYMQAYVPLRRQIEIQGVMRNEHRVEPVLVKTYTY
jgi:hypothetical protein